MTILQLGNSHGHHIETVMNEPHRGEHTFLGGRIPG